MRTLPALAALLSLLAAAPLARAGELIPFVLPWDDDAPGVTDLSGYNHSPAGKFGYISVDENAHFSVNGERVRLLGVNITDRSCFPTHAEAEAIAGRLAKFGINIVRFHHMDNNWGGASLIDYAKGNSRSLHAGNLELLDYFVAQLKSRGIYTNFNLVNSRDLKTADGLDSSAEATLTWKERHILTMVDPIARALEKEYATNLLEHVNTHTGLAYADDPAIAVVEVNNENGIFQQYFEGALDRWPDVYKSQLQAKWNDWLSAKYPDTVSLLAAWSGESEALGPELITNGNFSDGQTSWNVEQHDVARVTATTDNYFGRQAVKLDITTTSPESWHVQMNQSGKQLVAGQLYTLSFRVRADAERSFDAGIGLAYEPYSSVHSFPGITATTEWAQHTFIFEAGVSDSNLRLNFSGFVSQNGPIYFTDISLRSGGDLAATLPEGQSLEAANIANNLRSQSYLPKRALDWTRFLTELATDYWIDMRDHIKNELGYGGLVNGSTIMNSPPNIQAVYDFADTHAYWQHPVFPGAEWDPNNWYVNPLSMANTLDSTIAGLARQRLDGYPHTVSEYRHAYPNPFASEGPLMIAAYAALQDWDGIYFFDYAEGESWDQGYFSGYFNMNAHPSAMANTLVAANLFRRGDVSAAQGQLLMKFDPETEIEAITNRGQAWNVGDGRQLDIPAEHFAVQRVALSVGEDATGLSEPPAGPAGPVYASDTGELTWDVTNPERGFITIDTPRTVGVIGYVSDGNYGNESVGIEIGDTQESWATLTLTLMKGSFSKPQSDGSLLIVATGLTENTNMVWTDETKSSVGSNWGETPSRVESIPATITLPYPPERLQAWALDETGQRAATLTIAASAGGSSLQIGNVQKSLWYEVEIAAAQSFESYIAWRDLHWDAEDQANDAVSGPSADPDGDKIANLIEFFATLDPNVADATSPIQLEVVWRDRKPVFVYTLPFDADYPIDTLGILASTTLQDWTLLDSDSPEVDISTPATPPNQLRIEFAPTTFPVFLRLGGQ